MNGLDLAESLLRRDRIILYALIGVLFVLASICIVYGVGMRKTGLEMTTICATCRI